MNVTLSVDDKLYKKYRRFTKKAGHIISRKFEIFMEEEMKK